MNRIDVEPMGKELMLFSRTILFILSILSKTSSLFPSPSPYRQDQDLFDRIYRIDWIMMFHLQAGRLPVSSSAPGGGEPFSRPSGTAEKDLFPPLIVSILSKTLLFPPIY